MPKFSEDKLAIGCVAALAVWTLVVLPLLYYPALGNPVIAVLQWLGHDAVGAFTGLLVLVTAGLVAMGLRQEWWMRKHERAYVIAGPGYRQREEIEGQEKENWLVIGIGITAGNYGRTPAFLKQITVGLCPLTDGPLPPYPPFITCEDVLYPNYNRRDVDVLVTIPISGNEEQICYGRIVYSDIFGREHWSSWKHRILANKGRGSIALEGSYSTGWDYNRKQKKSDPP